MTCDVSYSTKYNSVAKVIANICWKVKLTNSMPYIMPMTKYPVIWLTLMFVWLCLAIMMM